MNKGTQAKVLGVFSCMAVAIVMGYFLTAQLIWVFIAGWAFSFWVSFLLRVIDDASKQE